MGLIRYSIILAAVMNVENIFNKNEDEDKDKEKDKDNTNVEKAKSNDLRNVLDIRMVNPNSDHLTYLNVIISLLKSNDSERNLRMFCQKYHLNIKRVKEMLDLLEQITKIAKLTFKISNIDYKILTNPNTDEQNLLIQILLSGFIDNIARRKVIQDRVGNDKDIASNLSAKRLIYECNENNHECQIHPNSIIAKSKPDFVIYKEIVKENKTFLICNTIIKPEWVYNIGGELVSYSIAGLSNINEPFYNKKEDEITCFVNIKYGYKSWEIQNVRVSMKKEDENYIRWFARFLLEGKILEEFKVYIIDNYSLMRNT